MSIFASSIENGWASVEKKEVIAEHHGRVRHVQLSPLLICAHKAEMSYSCVSIRCLVPVNISISHHPPFDFFSRTNAHHFIPAGNCKLITCQRAGSHLAVMSKGQSFSQHFSLCAETNSSAPSLSDLHYCGLIYCWFLSNSWTSLSSLSCHLA
jgi:hypothetical protein